MLVVCFIYRLYYNTIVAVTRYSDRRAAVTCCRQDGSTITTSPGTKLSGIWSPSTRSLSTTMPLIITTTVPNIQYASVCQCAPFLLAPSCSIKSISNGVTALKTCLMAYFLSKIVLIRLACNKESQRSFLHSLKTISRYLKWVKFQMFAIVLGIRSPKSYFSFDWSFQQPKLCFSTRIASALKPTPKSER